MKRPIHRAALSPPEPKHVRRKSGMIAVACLAGLSLAACGQAVPSEYQGVWECAAGPGATTVFEISSGHVTRRQSGNRPEVRGAISLG
jgi:hypothetical protein